MVDKQPGMIPVVNVNTMIQSAAQLEINVVTDWSLPVKTDTEKN